MKQITDLSPIENLRDLFLKRNAEVFEESGGFFFVLGSGNQGDSQTKDIAEIFIGCFRENSVFFDTDRNIADSVD